MFNLKAQRIVFIFAYRNVYNIMQICLNTESSPDLWKVLLFV